MDIPAKAIKCFEALTKLKLSYYLYSPVFRSVLQHTEHFCSPCIKAKRAYTYICSRFDGHTIHDNIAKFPDGVVKICHCGLAEITIPLIHNEEILAIFNAGVFRVLPDVLENLPVIRNSSDQPGPDISEVALCDREQLELYFEAMRQFTSRLLLWYQKMTPDDAAVETLSGRQRLMYILKHDARSHLTLAKLAKRLNLSYSRCAHLVKEVSGKNFSELIRSYRLDYACNLLKHSDCGIEKVCHLSGFGNVANFHRTFKAELGMTPQEYRKNGQEADALFSQIAGNPS